MPIALADVVPKHTVIERGTGTSTVPCIVEGRDFNIPVMLHYG